MSKTYTKFIIIIFHLILSTNCRFCSSQHQEFSKAGFIISQICQRPIVFSHLLRQVCPRSNPYCLQCNPRKISLQLNENHSEIFDHKSQKFSLLEKCSTLKSSSYHENVHACYNESQNQRCFSNKIKQIHYQNFCPNISLYINNFENFENDLAKSNFPDSLFRCCRESLRKTKFRMPTELSCRPRYELIKINFRVLTKRRHVKRAIVDLPIVTNCCGEIRHIIKF